MKISYRIITEILQHPKSIATVRGLETIAKDEGLMDLIKGHASQKDFPHFPEVII